MTEAPLLDPLIGAVVAGRYHVERRLAAGGMGVVYVARQEPLGRKVALKVIRGDAHDPVAQLRFLHELLRLATTAQTWEELLGTVVDGTRVALRAQVSSLYLMDRDGMSLTLAATNGMDRHHIGRATVPFGEGITGRTAASRVSSRG